MTDTEATAPEQGAHPRTMLLLHHYEDEADMYVDPVAIICVERLPATSAIPVIPERTRIDLRHGTISVLVRESPELIAAQAGWTVLTRDRDGR